MPDTPTVAARGPIARPAPLRQAVYDALTDLIINGTLKPGQHLVEAELADHLGVSRQPIREALQRLHTTGWVDLRPAQGAFVHSPLRRSAPNSSASGASWRPTPHAAPRNTPHPTTSTACGNCSRWGSPPSRCGDARAIVEANAALHGHITHLSLNAVLAELIPQVDRRVRWYYMPIAKPRGTDAWSEHAQIIQAIADGDPERAEQLMRRRHPEHRRLLLRADRRGDRPPHPVTGARAVHCPGSISRSSPVDTSKTKPRTSSVCGRNGEVRTRCIDCRTS